MVRAHRFGYHSLDLQSAVTEMELKKLHLGTMSYAVDSMDEVAHQLAMAMGAAESGQLYL